MDAIVKARVDAADKDVAAAVLKELGLNLSDLIRLAIIQTAKTKKLPIELGLTPESLSAIKEVEEGHARRVSQRARLALPDSPPPLAKGSAQ